MRLSVVIVNWNSCDDLRACLHALRRQTHRELETIVVDNGSADGSPAMVRGEFPEVTLLAQTENLGFAEACNRGIDASTSAWVAMLNNDTVADPDWAAALVDAARKAEPSCGMLQSQLLFQSKPDTINSTGLELARGGGGRDRDAGKPFVRNRDPDTIFCPTAGAAAYRRTMLDAIKLPTGYFDRRHFMYYEDMDLGWRARLAGWSALFVPTSIVLHRWHGSSDRHGKSWLAVIGATNRIRTLTKNASFAFGIRAAPHIVSACLKVIWFGKLPGIVGLSRAVYESVVTRGSVTKLATQRRRDVEVEWYVKSG